MGRSLRCHPRFWRWICHQLSPRAAKARRPTRRTPMDTSWKAGLQDVIAARSAVCAIDGAAGRLFYRGYEIGELAGVVPFEEVTALLWSGERPDGARAADLRARLEAARGLPEPIEARLRALPRDCHPLDALRTAISLDAVLDPDAADSGLEANLRKSFRLMARVPEVVAAWHRIRTGRAPVTAPPGGSHAAYVLRLLEGREPSEEVARVMDVALTLHADHEFNASTFAARVAVATLADLHAAVVAAIATLKGPRHGGANEDGGSHGPRTSVRGGRARLRRHESAHRPARERRLLLGGRLRRARDPRRPLHVDLRDRARRGLVRARDGAVCGQPADPAARGLRRRRAAPAGAGGLAARRLHEHAAGDAAARVARGVGLEVVGARVNDERAAVGVPHRRRPRAERELRGGRLHAPVAVGGDREVRQVARVRALRIQRAVLLVQRIEVTAGAVEIRRVALADSGNGHAVRPGRQAPGLHDDAHDVAGPPQLCKPDRLARGVLEIGDGGV